MEIRFVVSDNVPRHQCDCRRDGEWMIFTCPHCPGFERRLNYCTGEVKNRPGRNPDALHEGYFQPVGFEVEGGPTLN